MATELKEFFKNSDIEKPIHPYDLLLLFKKYAPHALTQNEARIIFKELTTYLTEEEEHKLFIGWELLHLENQPELFYGTMHDLLEKFEK